MGIGSILYAGLEETLRRMNILNLNACIAYPETEDEHLTKASVEFHQRLGYRMVGEFHQCGYKGSWGIALLQGTVVPSRHPVARVLPAHSNRTNLNFHRATRYVGYSSSG